jgi:hypothetical protein
MFALIRSGVQLRPVKQNGPPSPPPSMTDSHQQLLRTTLANINRVTREASPEADSEDESDDFDE